ncbi:hypothetical protein AKJ09_02437 [Labilithrix luteola]|uniref:Uncharacterized protein n=1 Tax=Labilithrix luteola TaxID=1391654 RepID=A0A0K1PQH4_9BACT|nr:hypothetical protein AKJ09_02437 [Labilithrix luteola]
MDNQDRRYGGPHPPHLGEELRGGLWCTRQLADVWIHHETY